MSNGNKHVFFSTRERAASDDWNKLQTFIAAARQDQLRDQFNGRRLANGRYFAQGRWPDPLPANELPHDVYGGLMARPDTAASLQVDPGTAGFIIPGSGGADDSDYVVVTSAGVSDASLAWTPNSSGSARVDVLECRAVESTVVQQVRKIFDPVAQVFNDQLVDKIKQYEIEFRIAVGTPNGGVRLPDSEWCPLAAIFVHDGATGFDVCEVYDIRPLVNERVNDMVRGAVLSAQDLGFRSMPKRMILSKASASDSSNSHHQGGFWESEWGGYRVGGEISAQGARRVDLSHVENRLTTVTLGSSPKIMALCAYYPSGYPRWVRYTTTPLSVSEPLGWNVVGRVPGNTAGILILTPLDQVQGNGITLVQSAFHSKFAGMSAIGHMVCACKTTPRATTGGLNSGFHFPRLDGGSPLVSSPAVGAISTTASFELNVAAGVPPTASAALVRVYGALTMNTVSDRVSAVRVEARHKAADGDLFWSCPIHFLGGGDGSLTMNFRFTEWVTLAGNTAYDAAQNETFLQIIFDYESGAVTAVDLFAEIHGYKIG